VETPVELVDIPELLSVLTGDMGFSGLINTSNKHMYMHINTVTNTAVHDVH